MARPEDLLVSNLALLERVIAFACRRHHLDEAEREDFASSVKLKLIENDYAILRKFEGRSSFATYLNVVVQRLLLDYRVHEWGKWHPSAEAKRLGEMARDLEVLLHRDGRDFEAALREIQSRYPGTTRASVDALARRLPVRPPRRRMVELAEAEAVGDDRQQLADEIRNGELARTSAAISAAIRPLIEALPAVDRLILQLRFESGMTVAEIARALQLDQKLLYRRLQKQMSELRHELERRGIGARDALDVIGRESTALEFEIGKMQLRPSRRVDESMATGTREGL